MTYKYQLIEGKPMVVGMPEIKEPNSVEYDIINNVFESRYYIDVEKYEKLIASLPQYPMLELYPEWEGREDLQEFIDFRTGISSQCYDRIIAFPITKEPVTEKCICEVGHPYNSLACPVHGNIKEPVNNTSVSEDELWGKVFTEMGIKNDGRNSFTIKQLKKKFTISYNTKPEITNIKSAEAITKADFVNIANHCVGKGVLQTGFANFKLAQEYASQFNTKESDKRCVWCDSKDVYNLTQICKPCFDKACKLM